MPAPARPSPFPSYRGTAGPGLGSAETLILILVTLALAGSWAAAVLPAENSFINVDAVGRLVMTSMKTSIYYLAHGLAIASAMAAGLLAAWIGGFRILSINSRLALCVLAASAAIRAVTTYTADELLSSQIFGATGPFVWFTLVFLMAGTDRRVWKHVDLVIRVLAYVSTVLALRTLMTSEYRSYAGFSQYTLYTQLLMWLGGWTLLSATRLRGMRLLARTVPFWVTVLMAICGQSRSWTILSCLLGITFLLLRSRDQGSLASAMRTLTVATVLCCAAAAVVYTAFPDIVSDSLGGLSDRLDEDSRSGQYKAFFSVVPVGDLLLGRGPKGTWYWREVGDYQFFDNGYLWMLFIGGVPTLLCYFAIVVWPAIRGARCNPPADAAAVFLVLLWGLALTGLSTFCLPSVGIANYVVSLWAGRCHLLLAESAGKKTSPARQAAVLPSPGRTMSAYPWNHAETAPTRAWRYALGMFSRT